MWFTLCDLLSGVKAGLVQNGLQDPQVPVAVQATEVLLGGEEGGSGPPFHHRPVPPAADAPGAHPHPRTGTLDQVRAHQAAPKAGRKSQAVDGEDLLQTFQKAGGQPWVSFFSIIW